MTTPIETLTLARDFRVRFEPEIPHFYKDRDNRVCISSGVVVDGMIEARTLLDKIGAESTETLRNVLAQDWSRVKNAPAAKSMELYASKTILRLAPDMLRALTMKLLGETADKAAARVEGFASFPQSVQVAVIDMMLTGGPPMFGPTAGAFVELLRTRNWGEASFCVHRRALGKARSDAAVDLFLDAASMPSEMPSAGERAIGEEMGKVIASSRETPTKWVALPKRDPGRREKR